METRFQAGETVYYQAHKVTIVAYAVNHSNIICKGVHPKEVVVIDLTANNRRLEVCEDALHRE